MCPHSTTCHTPSTANAASLIRATSLSFFCFSASKACAVLPAFAWRVGTHAFALHTSAYVKHPSAYVSIRQHLLGDLAPTRSRCIHQHTSACVSIRQHPSAYVSIRQHTSASVSIRQHTSAYVRIWRPGTHTFALPGATEGEDGGGSRSGGGRERGAQGLRYMHVLLGGSHLLVQKYKH